MYFQANQYAKAEEFLTGRREMLDYLSHFGYSFYPLYIRAAALTETGRFDSALHYFRIAEPLITERGNTEVKATFYQSFGDYYNKTRDFTRAIDYYQRAYGLMAAAKDIENEEVFADSLQRLYERAGDFRSALLYNRLAVSERDSLRAQTRETELMRLEMDNENRRKERIAREEELNAEHRHNIQYMGFTVGLVLLFITIVVLGHLVVPVPVIRTVVFLSFIFLFEFIVLLMDKTIQAWTHDEPWQVLLIKIVLAAGLVPLHHWLEHKVVHILSHRRAAVAVASHKI
jgi:tetratricopeptide (TPR) repeat protein